MPLKRKRDGTYVIKTKDDAIQAIKEADSIMDEIREQEEQRKALKKSAAFYMRDKGIDGFKIAGKMRALVRPTSRLWVVTEEDIPENLPDDDAAEVRPLEDILNAAQLEQVTKLVVDPEKMEQAIGLGIVDEEEIADAYLEIQNPNSVYVR